jgi:hypothetical protein
LVVTEIIHKTRPGRPERKGLKISGQAFGVGAFEEDDDDVYARDDMANYDFSLPSGKVSCSA